MDRQEYFTWRYYRATTAPWKITCWLSHLELPVLSYVSAVIKRWTGELSPELSARQSRGAFATATTSREWWQQVNHSFLLAQPHRTDPHKVGLFCACCSPVSQTRRRWRENRFKIYCSGHMHSGNWLSARCCRRYCHSRYFSVGYRKMTHSK